MMLPVIDQPVYTLQLISQKTPIRFRPFTVKEQKILFMAKEGKEIESVLTGLKQIARNCVVDDIDIEALPLVDLELLFLNLRARSMGEVAELVYKCTNEVEGNACGMLIEVNVDLLNVDIINKDFQSRVMITDDVGVQMRLPTFDMIKQMDKSPEEHKDVLLAALCVDYVFDKESVYHSKETTLEELMNFMEQLPIDKYEKIENYFKNVPMIKQDVVRDCPKCAYKHKFVLEGLEDFFM